jgi:hypothetical protein
MSWQLADRVIDLKSVANPGQAKQAANLSLSASEDQTAPGLPRTDARAQDGVDTRGVHEREPAQIKHHDVGSGLHITQSRLQLGFGREIQFSGELNPGNIAIAQRPRAPERRRDVPDITVAGHEHPPSYGSDSGRAQRGPSLA